MLQPMSYVVPPNQQIMFIDHGQRVFAVQDLRDKLIKQACLAELIGNPCQSIHRPGRAA